MHAFDILQEKKISTFFNSVHHVFQQAEEHSGESIDLFYTIGGYTIRMCFANPALVSLITPALEHLTSKPISKPSLTVCLWDSVSTQTKMPPPPWSSDAYITHGKIRDYNNGRFCTIFHLGSYVLNMLDNNQNLAFFWIRNSSQLPYYESGSPLRTILHCWMREHKRQLIHSAAVGTPNGGVLLAGKGGSGKSTAAFACLNSKLNYVSDDYCLLQTDPVPYIYSLYNSGKLDTNNIHRFPHLSQAISNKSCLDKEKALFFLYRHFPKKIMTGFPIRAILIPRLTGLSDTRLKKTSSAACLMALAPSTIFQLPGTGLSDFQYLTNFVKKVPTFSLEIGTDISKIPNVILNLLSEN